MSLTIFLAICVIGCDVLIYFLYEWAFGESERIRKRQARSSRLWADPAETGPKRVSRSSRKPSGGARVIEMNRSDEKPTPAPSRTNPQERLAYRRLVASFSPAKPRP